MDTGITDFISLFDALHGRKYGVDVHNVSVGEGQKGNGEIKECRRNKYNDGDNSYAGFFRYSHDLLLSFLLLYIICKRA